MRLTKISLILFTLIFSFSTSWADGPQELRARVAGTSQKEPCTKSKTGKILMTLRQFAQNPDPKASASLANQLCRISPDGHEPCPISLNQDLVIDLKTSGERVPQVIPVMACAAAVAEGAIRQELLEGLAALFDRHQGRFFSTWGTLSPWQKNLAPKWEEFLMTTGDFAADDAKKLLVFDKRAQVLQTAPSWANQETKIAFRNLRETADQIRSTQSANALSGDLQLVKSRFFEIVGDKAIRLSQGDSKRLAQVAEGVAAEVGLNYKFYLKSSQRDWVLCSTRPGQQDTCSPRAITFGRAADDCSEFGYGAVLAQSQTSWIFLTNTSPFKVDINDYFIPKGVWLKKSDHVVRKWNTPEGFEARAISEDLSILYMQAPIKSAVGRTLATLTLQISPVGPISFIEKIPDQKIITLTAPFSQKLKSRDGVNFNLSKNTCP
ncbi:MAG: hypothetical protein IT289_07925 [Oligoflexia bacterium]|nr:hypothetical protein [Oligoflexia bacterium]